jgi:hypothetical protein
MPISVIYDIAVNIVFWATMVAAFCALLDRWLGKWVKSYPKSKYQTVMQAIEDLCDQIGSVFKDKLAPKVWDGQDRRDDKANGVGA